ncbi:restriction endonuclease subunit S [Vibrio splendidus]|uniref:restriction endonuclease subunit S n=1 Tax=Vibrio splendidus TaxID=29497 RepID=UPI000C867036|nr:restriction endonuclease subunit S [Vibrio splendidus]PMO97938.1 hypothetical protein BCS97_09505 [Vibrio splendidus]PMP25395.1 hypothetical protein BCS89_02485 [Vibrio splendidus]PMP39563.1 hypothetical protein BCS87_09770 [Vibrio splendidus]PMP41655.1 hypothetical protein BCS88_00215 [Vibrio splendidus]PMP47777.1 hypothetical protein BCS85_11500 [Vibrio splendidus]
MVPNGWETHHLEDLATKISDGIHSTPKYADKSPVFFVNGNNLKNGKIVIQTTTKHVDEEDAKKHRKDLNDRTILMSINGTIGNLAYYGGENVVLGKSASYINVSPNTDVEFIYYVLSSEKTQAFFTSELTGSTIKNLSLKTIKLTKIDTPPLPEQRKIAKILSTWDKAIATTEKLIETSKQQKKSLMQQLLTGKRRLVNPDTGKMFEGEWEEIAVGNFGVIYSGGTPSTSNKEYWDGDIDWITPTDITKQDNVYISSSKRRISVDGLKNSSAKLVPKGSLLVCTRATIGEMAITAHEMCTNQGFKNIIPNESTNVEFVFYLLTYEKHQLVSKASGSTFLELSKSAFESMKFNVPPIGEQQKIASVLTAADKEIEVLEAKLAHFKQEKKALMQQLLTGKRRVKVDEMEVA